MLFDFDLLKTGSAEEEQGTFNSKVVGSIPTQSINFTPRETLMIQAKTFVKCVDTSYFPDSDIEERNVSLNKKKKYYVIAVSDEKGNPHIRIINDKNKTTFYRAWRFKPV